MIAEVTLRLAGEAVEVEAVEPLTLKGKSEPVPAFRLLQARAVTERRHDRVFVGRARELLAQVGAATFRVWFESGPVDALEQLARKALPLLEQTEDHAGLV